MLKDTPTIPSHIFAFFKSQTATFIYKRLESFTSSLNTVQLFLSILVLILIHLIRAAITRDNVFVFMRFLHNTALTNSVSK